MSNMKIKLKSNDGVVKAKVQMKHEMLTYNAAKGKGTTANFITYVVGKVGERKVFELSTSQFLSKNPILKFKFKADKAEVLEMTWTDLSGKIVMESKKIK